MSIKTWQERAAKVDPDAMTPTGIQWAMQAEIDELRAALQERDAEIERLKDKEDEADLLSMLVDVLNTEIAAQRKVLEQALEALESLFGVPAEYTGVGGGGVAVWRLGGSCKPTQAIAVIRGVLK